jgi:uncharacterized protein (DUF983 family)
MQQNDGVAIFGTEERQTERPFLRSVMRGAVGTCPACGKGHLFSRLLTTHQCCEACGEELFHHRADDLPAYLNILCTGHVVVGSMLILLTLELLPMWTLTGITVAAAIGVAFALMRPLKGMVIGAQWALGMHGFGEHDG